MNEHRLKVFNDIPVIKCESYIFMGRQKTERQYLKYILRDEMILR